MKYYIHDGLSLRVMKGQDQELGAGVDTPTCPCGYVICPKYGKPIDEIFLSDDVCEPLPDGWAPTMNGYKHPSGAEVIRAGDFYAWYPPGEEECLPTLWKDTKEEAFIAAYSQGWSMIHDWEGHPVYIKGLHMVYTDGELWKHNQNPQAYYITHEAAMIAAEKFPK